jgi:hypothetical protein
MKKIILFAIFIIATVQFSSAQNAIAKLKFEEAEEAFVKEEYQTTITKLEEVEKILGNVNPLIMYLRVKTQNELIVGDPYEQFELMQSLKKNCEYYLTRYEGFNDIEDKYKEVYLISEYFKLYSSNINFFNAREYYLGKNGSVDYDKAKSYCDNAISDGDVAALHLMGLMFKNGHGVQKDFSKAIEYFQKSADNGCSFGLLNMGNEYYLGKNLLKDANKAIGLYEEAAAKGLPNAMQTLGFIYYNGELTEKDYTKAFYWFSKAADRKMASSMEYLGYIYLNGFGINKDIQKAESWFKKAAANGADYSYFNLGWMYYHGHGVTQNFNTALRWFQKGVEKDQLDCIIGAADTYRYGLFDYPRALDLFSKAMDRGSVPSITAIGHFYYEGLGMNKDYLKAMEYYTKAAEKNHLPAIYQIIAIYTSGGFGTKRNKTKAAEWQSIYNAAKAKK